METTDATRRGGRLVLAAMLLVSGAGCSRSSHPAASSPPARQQPTEVRVTRIPAGFPIDVDLRSMTGDGGVIDGPSAQSHGAGAITACQERLWPPAHVTDRLAVVGSGPEFADIRELVLLPDADAAATWLARTRAAIVACPTEDNQLDPEHSPDHLWREHDGVDTGYDSLSFAQTYPEGLGGALFQVTRVDRALVLVASSAEYPPDPQPESFDKLTALGRVLTGSLIRTAR